MPQDATSPGHSHARIPTPIAWVQDNLLLGLLMLASGVINAHFLVYGLVPDSALNDPSQWGWLNAIQICALAAAGLTLGGLEVRISYKLGEMVAESRAGRAVFLAFGLAVLAFIEFWASFSQRSQNIPPTPADHALLNIFGVTNPSLSVTAMCIAGAIPFVSVFWGFAADDPAPKPVEDADHLQQRLANEATIAAHKANMLKLRAGGVRAAIQAAVTKEEEPESPPIVESETEESDDESASIPEQDEADDPPQLTFIPRTIARSGSKIWTTGDLKSYVEATYGIKLSKNEAITIVRRVGKDKKTKGPNTPWGAPIAALKREAERLYGAPAKEESRPSAVGE